MINVAVDAAAVKAWPVYTTLKAVRVVGRRVVNLLANLITDHCLQVRNAQRNSNLDWFLLTSITPTPGQRQMERVAKQEQGPYWFFGFWLFLSTPSPSAPKGSTPTNEWAINRKGYPIDHRD
jgi:hypothetical protein